MNIFPLHLLKSAEKSYMLVELKSGETYNGVLEKCDRFMNIKLVDAVLTTKDGSQFYKISEVYIKGSSLKYAQMQEIVLERAIEETPKYKNAYTSLKNKNKFKPSRGKSEPARGKIKTRGN